MSYKWNSPRYTISSSDGTSLHFPDASLYVEYNKARFDLDNEFYLKIRARHGIWAGNQDKFVNSLDELNEWDCDIMENRIRHLL